jgi:hypothetical protein
MRCRRVRFTGDRSLHPHHRELGDDPRLSDRVVLGMTRHHPAARCAKSRPARAPTRRVGGRWVGARASALVA